jgi:hypothetical protein
MAHAHHVACSPCRMLTCLCPPYGAARGSDLRGALWGAEAGVGGAEGELAADGLDGGGVAGLGGELADGAGAEIEDGGDARGADVGLEELDGGAARSRGEVSGGCEVGEAEGRGGGVGGVRQLERLAAKLGFAHAVEELVPEVGAMDARKEGRDARGEVGGDEADAEEIGEAAGVVERVEGDAVVALLAEVVPEGVHEVPLVADRFDARAREADGVTERVAEGDFHAAAALERGRLLAHDGEVEVAVDAAQDDHVEGFADGEHAGGEEAALGDGGGDDAVVLEAEDAMVGDGHVHSIAATRSELRQEWNDWAGDDSSLAVSFRNGGVFGLARGLRQECAPAFESLAELERNERGGDESSPPESFRWADRSR